MSKNDVDLRERQRRQAVLVKPRGVVLVKLFGMDPIPGVPERPRDDKALRDRRELEALTRGLDLKAYRPTGDTGFCKFEKEPLVRVTNLVAQLRELGLRYAGPHYQWVEDKNKPVNILNFNSDGEEVEISPEVLEVLGMRFGHVSLWCNLRYYRDGRPGQYRLDTINLVGGHQSQKPARELMVQGNTYRLV